MKKAGRKVVIRRTVDKGPGWDPIQHLVTLMQRLLGAEIETVEPTRPKLVRRIQRTFIHPRCSGDEVVIHLAHEPSEIGMFIAAPGFDRPAACRVLWIVDSFWTQRVPWGLISAFDLVVYM